MQVPHTAALLAPLLSLAPAALAQLPDRSPVSFPSVTALAPLPGAAPSISDIETNALVPARLFASSSAGLLRSDDRGQQWSVVSRWPSPGGRLADLAVANTDPERLAVALPLAGLFVSNDGGLTWGPTSLGAVAYEFWTVAIDPVLPDTMFVGGEGGVWRTTDGGISFDHVVDLTGTGQSCYDVFIDRNNRQRIYANSQPGELLVSEDGGDTWASRSGPIGSTFYLSAALDPRDGNRLAMTGSDLWISDDGGLTWSDIWPFSGNLIDRCAFDPRDADRIYASVRAEGMYATDDGGVTWTLLSGAGHDRMGPRPECYLFHPAFPGEIMVGGEGGFLRSSDDGATFARSNDGLDGVAFVRSVAANSANPMHLVAQTGGSVYVSLDGGSSWTESSPIPGFSAFEVVADRAIPGRFYAGSQSTTGGLLWRSDDGGFSWTLAFDDPSMYFWHVEPHPTLPGVLYGAGRGVRRSDDGGLTFTSLGFPASWVWDVAVSPSDPDVIYANSSSNVFVSRDGGATWTGATTPPAPIVRNLCVHPTNPDIAYASVPLTGLYRTADGGATWNLVSSAPVDASYAHFARGAGDRLMVGSWTESRIIVDPRGSAPFRPLGPELGSPIVTLSSAGGVTYVSTEGSGALAVR